MGRFINADSYASTGQGFLGYNMFAYCENNPINMLDLSGFDAIWIQEGNSAFGEGHSGLLVQDADGNWHYFYWGPKKEGIQFGILLIGVPSRMVLSKMNVESHDLTKTSEVRIVVANSEDPFIRERAGKITATYYFKGDYTATYNWLVKSQQETDCYQLLTDNCVQRTIEAMKQSDSRFDQSFSNIPNNAELAVFMMQSFDIKANPWSLFNKCHNSATTQ